MRGTWGFAMLWCWCFYQCGDAVNKISTYGVAVISNLTVCDICVFLAACGVRWNEIICGAGASCLIFLKPKFDLNWACKLRQYLLIYDKHVPLRLIICNKIQMIFNILRLPIRSCFHLYVTWSLPTGAHPVPNAERSAFGRQVHVEERGQKQSWSLETPRPNIMHWLRSIFFYEKRKKVAKTTSHKIYSDVASAGKKEGFLS